MKGKLFVAPIVVALAAFMGASRAVWAQTAGVHVLKTAEDKVLRITVQPAVEPRHRRESPLRRGVGPERAAPDRPPGARAPRDRS